MRQRRRGDGRDRAEERRPHPVGQQPLLPRQLPPLRLRLGLPQPCHALLLGDGGAAAAATVRLAHGAGGGDGGRPLQERPSSQRHRPPGASARDGQEGGSGAAKERVREALPAAQELHVAHHALPAVRAAGGSPQDAGGASADRASSASASPKLGKLGASRIHQRSSSSVFHCSTAAKQGNAIHSHDHVALGKMGPRKV